MSKEKERKQYSEEFKRQVAEEYIRGELNIPDLRRKYGIASFASVHAWIHKYSNKESGEAKRGFYVKSESKKRSVETSEYSKRLYDKFMQGLETGEMPEFDNAQERTAFIFFENLYLKKKLLLEGESPDFIASLWSSKNMGDVLERLGLVDVLE